MRRGDLRRSTFNWCRSTRFSACSDARDRNSPTKANQISLQKLSISREHQPIQAKRQAGDALHPVILKQRGVMQEATKHVGCVVSPKELSLDDEGGDTKYA